MKFITGHSFSYDIKECVPHYYQVEGHTDPDTSCGGGAGGGYVVTTVTACDPTEICDALKAQGHSLSIKKILKVKQPVLTKDATDDCPTDVTPIPVEQCQPPSTQNLIEQRVHKSRRVNDNIPFSYGDTTSPQHTTHLVGPATHGGGLLKLAQGDFEFIAGGILHLYDDTLITADFDGDLQTDIPVETYLEGEAISEISGAAVPSTPIPLFLDDTIVPCCDRPIPLVLEFKHNLNLIPDLSRFLHQNNLSIPGASDAATDFVKLNFLERSDTWAGNIHLSGNTTVGSGNERWDFNVSFGCNPQGTWDFVLSISLRRPNQRFISRFAAGFLTSSVCRDGNFYKLPFSYLDGATVPSASVVTSDESGFFRNLRLLFKVFPQRVSLLGQLEEDNTIAQIATNGDS